MKRLSLIVVLALGLGVAHGQGKLKGTFCTSQGYAGYCLTFKNDSLFEYSSWSCLGGDEGSGVYRINKKTLLLHFISNDTVISSFLVKEKNCTITDSVTLTFAVKDKPTNESLPFSFIGLISSSQDTIRAVADSNGIVILKVKKSNDSFFVTTSYVGYSYYSFKIKADNCKEIKISLDNRHFGVIENGTVREYRIKKQTSKKLILHELDYKSNTVLYKKKV